MAVDVYINTAQTVITTAWTLITLRKDTGITTPVGVGPYTDHFELVGDTSGGPATLDYAFTYDSAGVDPASGGIASLAARYTLDTPPGATGGTANYRSAVVGLGVYVAKARSGRTPGTDQGLYFWAKVNAGTLTLTGTTTGFTLVMRHSSGGVET